MQAPGWLPYSCTPPKILFWHYGRAKNGSILATLHAQLDDRRAKDISHDRYDQRYLGLVWLVSYEWPEGKGASPSEIPDRCFSREEWAESLAENGLVVRHGPVDRPSGALFDHVATLDVNSIWPVLDTRTATLWLTLVEARLA
jgi:hypothetical protein